MAISLVQLTLPQEIATSAFHGFAMTPMRDVTRLLDSLAALTAEKDDMHSAQTLRGFDEQLNRPLLRNKADSP